MVRVWIHYVVFFIGQRFFWSVCVASGVRGSRCAALFALHDNSPGWVLLLLLIVGGVCMVVGF